MPPVVSILQNGISNVGSVCNALRFLNLPFEVITDADGLKRAKILIFPGVGAFGAAMTQLNENGLTDVLKQKIVGDKIPFLGICLGLQLLFESSEESAGVTGLGIFKGSVRRLTEKTPEFRVPNIGWCELFSSSTYSSTSTSSILSSALHQSVYFVHSFSADPSDRSIVSSQAQHTQPFVASIAQDNIQALQFHPEKSGTVGLGLLKNFVQWNHHGF